MNTKFTVSLRFKINNFMSNKEHFASKIGAVAALAGSAIGLGNIWKFPYLTGENGGAAFILIYIACICFIGIPIMLAEFAIGRRGGKDVYGTFKTLAPKTKWCAFSIITVCTSAIILSYYGTIAGWTMHYMCTSFTEIFQNATPASVEQIFTEFTSHPYLPIIWQVLFMVLTAAVILGGVKNGIERGSKIMMPLLFAIIIVLCFRSLTLNEQSIDGLKFLFKPNLDVVTPKTFLAAMGQAFFSLSVGMGVIMTYGAYVKKHENIHQMSYQVVISDTTVAILAGVAILPATFAFGMAPNAGPGLVFLTLPQVFAQMPLGHFWSFIFFLLLVLAALTSSISLLEVTVAYLINELKMKRAIATILTTIVITIIGFFTTLAFGPLKHITLFGMNIFDIMDYTASNILLPLGGMLICYFAGFVLGKDSLRDEITNGNKIKITLFGFYFFIMRYVAPVVILLLMLNGMGLFN